MNSKLRNHFHILLEVPPMAQGGISDEELLRRLSAIYGEAFVAGVAQELADARAADYTSESGMDEAVAAVHQRFTYRMHDLAEFMKGLLQRFTQWFNRAHSRSGTLWEDRFKSVIVEDGDRGRNGAFAPLPPPNRTGGSPASGSPVSGLLHYGDWQMSIPGHPAGKRARVS